MDEYTKWIILLTRLHSRVRELLHQPENKKKLADATYSEQDDSGTEQEIWRYVEIIHHFFKKNWKK